MTGVFKPFVPDSTVVRTRRDLPHWQQDFCTYFITFRLADSLPQADLTRLNYEKAEWLRVHPKPWDEPTSAQYDKKFTAQIERWLDNGHGACVLRQPEISAIVSGALKHFDGERYALDEWVVMPNHVHVLVQPAAKIKLEELLHSWKSFTAHAINGILKRTDTLWMDEYYDHAVRTWRQMEAFRKYIRENPAKAGLKVNGFAVGCGSGIRESEADVPPAENIKEV
jgi:REP element-mobilizing transposase RayT